MSSASHEQLLLGEVQLLLAEKRTYFAILRTGLAVFVMPLTVLGIIVGSSQSQRIFRSPWVGALVLAVLGLTSLMGLYLAQRAQRRIHKINELIHKIESEDKRVAEIVI